jgi:hypothetical protein
MQLWEITQVNTIFRKAQFQFMSWEWLAVLTDLFMVFHLPSRHILGQGFKVGSGFFLLYTSLSFTVILYNVFT